MQEGPSDGAWGRPLLGSQCSQQGVVQAVRQSRLSADTLVTKPVSIYSGVCPHSRSHLPWLIGRAPMLQSSRPCAAFTGQLQWSGCRSMVGLVLVWRCVAGPAGRVTAAVGLAVLTGCAWLGWGMAGLGHAWVAKLGGGDRSLVFEARRLVRSAAWRVCR